MRKVARQGAAGAAFAAAMVATAMPAAAGVLDSLFGKTNVMDAASDQQRAWRLDEFTWVRVVEKEAGASANQHPVAVDAPALRTRLMSIQAQVRSSNAALFDGAELEALAPVLVRAFALAGPGDDVLLLSTARRGGLLAAPLAVTARLFVHGNALHVVVHDARYEFMEAYRRSHVNPKFSYGSRGKPGKTALRSESANVMRADWVAFPLSGLSATADVTAVPASPPRVAPAAAAAVMPATPQSVNAPSIPGPMAGSPAAAGDEIEQRLVTLKRLRDRNLITEEEYQHKRRELLQKL